MQQRTIQKAINLATQGLAALEQAETESGDYRLRLAMMASGFLEAAHSVLRVSVVTCELSHEAEGAEGGDK